MRNLGRKLLKEYLEGAEGTRFQEREIVGGIRIGMGGPIKGKGRFYGKISGRE